MTSYIVSAGSLLEVGCPSTLTRTTESQVSTMRTLGGKRKGFVRPGGRRTWSVDVSVARPSEVSTIETIARSGLMVGWYGPEAVIGNLLSPQASAFDAPNFNGTDVGLVQLPDGTAARAVALSGTMAIGAAHGSYEAIPVQGQASITFGGWGLGGIRFTGVWRDADLAQVGTLSGATFTHTGWAFRSQTVLVPEGAAYVSLSVLGATQVARPTVAWGTVARDELGTGCPKAVIHSPSHSPLALWEGTNYTDSSYSITEVG